MTQIIRMGKPKGIKLLIMKLNIGKIARECGKVWSNIGWKNFEAFIDKYIFQ